MINAIVITGPTASGKTDISIKLAEKLNGEIVSADSMQIYKGMDIGTAKPTEEEKHGIVHHMIDIAQPWEIYDVVEYKNSAVKCIKDISSRGKVPIITGGTGLYVNSLVENILYTEAVSDNEYRKELAKYAEVNGVRALHDRLKILDPDAAQTIHENNVKRVIRAIELSHITGMTQVQRNEESRKSVKEIDYTVYAVEASREMLYKRIETRVDKMIETGLVEEVHELRGKCLNAYREGISPIKTLSLTALQAIGYKEIISYLDNKILLKESIELIKFNTRHYAKRQITWFRKPLWVKWVTLEELSEIYEL